MLTTREGFNNDHGRTTVWTDIGCLLFLALMFISLLNGAKVAVTPGSAFGPSGEHHVRMTYCVDEDTINLAFDRIEDYFK